MNGIWLPYCNSISKLKLIVMNVFSLLREKLENYKFLQLMEWHSKLNAKVWFCEIRNKKNKESSGALVIKLRNAQFDLSLMKIILFSSLIQKVWKSKTEIKIESEESVLWVLERCTFSLSSGLSCPDSSLSIILSSLSCLYRLYSSSKSWVGAILFSVKIQTLRVKSSYKLTFRTMIFCFLKWKINDFIYR